MLLVILTVILALQLIDPTESKSPTAPIEQESPWNAPVSHLLLLTPSASISEELFDFGRQLAETYPEVSHGTLPDDFIKKGKAMHTTITTLDFRKNFDTFIIVPAIPGTTESFSRIAKLKPDARMIAICPMEPETDFRKGHFLLLGTQSPLKTPEDVIRECLDVLSHIAYERKDGKLFIVINKR